MPQFEDGSELWTRVVTRTYAEKWDLPIDQSFKVIHTGLIDSVDDEWNDWVVVNVPLGWTDPDGPDAW